MLGFIWGGCGTLRPVAAYGSHEVPNSPAPSRWAHVSAKLECGILDKIQIQSIIWQIHLIPSTELCFFIPARKVGDEFAESEQRRRELKRIQNVTSRQWKIENILSDWRASYGGCWGLIAGWRGHGLRFSRGAQLIALTRQAHVGANLNVINSTNFELSRRIPIRITAMFFSSQLARYDNNKASNLWKLRKDNKHTKASNLWL